MKAVRTIFAFVSLAVLAGGIWYSRSDFGFLAEPSHSLHKDKDGFWMMERSYYLLSDPNYLSMPPHDGVDRVDLRAWMTRYGVELSAGGEAYYDASDNKVVVRASPDEVDIISGLVFCGGCTGISSANSRSDRLRQRIEDWSFRTTFSIRERFFLSSLGIQAPIPGLDPLPTPLELRDNVVK